MIIERGPALTGQDMGTAIKNNKIQIEGDGPDLRFSWMLMKF